MVTGAWDTSRYKQKFTFEFKGKQYRAHSIVRLKPKARLALGALKNEAIIAESFINWNNIECWRYMCNSTAFTTKVRSVVTDMSPEDVIEEIIMEAPEKYSSRQIYGKNSPYFKENQIRHASKDWEFPELIIGWIVFIIAFWAVEIFNDELFKAYLRAIAWTIFAGYRKSIIDETVWYEYPEDEKIEKLKQCVLYENKTIEECGLDE